MFVRLSTVRKLQKRIEELEQLNESLRNRLEGVAVTQKPDRARYKEVWNALSDTRERAVAHVIGPVDEEELQKQAQLTVNNLVATVGVNPGDRILEIGCGVARVGKALAQLCARWTGCDVSENMLQHSADRLREFDNVDLIEISGYDLEGVADQSQDVVYSTIVFMHLDEWDRYAYIQEAFRVLKPGGRLYIDNFTLSTDDGWAVFESHTRFKPTERPPHISKASTAEELRAYFSRAGFIDIQSMHQALWVITWGRKPDTV